MASALVALVEGCSVKPAEAMYELSDLHKIRARYDPAAFCSYVLRDEKTGKPIMMQPMHEDWHSLYTYHSRLLIWKFVEAGGSYQMTVGRTLWELGRNPSLRIVIFSKSHEFAQQAVVNIAKYIDYSQELHSVFPHLKRAIGYSWTMNTLFVERPVLSRHPSVMALALHGQILGQRIDRLHGDDVVNYENAYSPANRADTYRWFKSTLTGRMTEDSKICLIGNPWHEDDLLSKLANEPGWKAVKIGRAHV